MRPLAPGRSRRGSDQPGNQLSGPAGAQAAPWESPTVLPGRGRPDGPPSRSKMTDAVVPPGDVDAAMRRQAAEFLTSTTTLGTVQTLFVVAVAILFACLPGHPPVDVPGFIALAAIVIASALIMPVVVREGPRTNRGTFTMFAAWSVGDAGAISAAVALTGGARSDLYLMYLVLAVFQGGVAWPRRARLAFNGLAMASYVTTLAVLGWHIGTATVFIRLGMLTVVTWGTDLLSLRLAGELRHYLELSLDSQRRARLWRKVADLGGSLDSLDPEAIWDWVIESVHELGYDVSGVTVLDAAHGQYRVARAAGLPPGSLAETYPLSVGISGRVLQADATVVVDHATMDVNLPAVVQAGLRTGIGVPVRVQGQMVAALLAGTRAVRHPSEEELAALELVAAHAGHGLAGARSLADQRRDADRVRTILASAPDAMVVYGPDLIIQRANHQAARLFGYDVEQLVGMDIRCLSDEQHRHHDQNFTERVVSSGSPAVLDRGQLRGRRKDGSSFPTEATLAPFETPDGRMVAVTVRDISERLAFERRLAHHATHDDLTGLPNRTLFLTNLTNALAARPTGTTATVCFIDVDHFKYVNDSRGHGVGDQLVTEVAERLRRRARTELVARFGGDEFAILSTDIADHHAAIAWAWRWLAALDRPFMLDGVECHVSASAGVAFGTSADTALDVMRRADAAMYHAKQRGRARVELFDEALTARAAWRLDVASALHDAVERGELYLEYQPVVRLPAGDVVGLEALLRWSRPTGMVGPATFIPVAEDSGLIVPIGRWVLHEACRRAATWFAQSAGNEPLTMSVNVSSRQLDHDHFIGDIAAVLDDTGIPPGSLVLEITESSFIDDLTAAVRRIDAVRQLGVQVAIDDFGTGFSSLSSLSRLPIDTVKIDKSFVDGLGTRYDTVIKAVVDVASTFGLRVVAEGVERTTQAEQLLALGCQYAQGFLFAKPLPEDRAAALFAPGADR